MLSDFEPDRQEIKLPKGGTFLVRGLGVDDLAILVRDYLGDMDKILALYEDSARSPLSSVATAQFVLKLTREAPAAVAQIIAIAADEPSEVDRARRLPLPVQVLALQHIGRLTFEEAGGLKKFLGDLKILIESMIPQDDQALIT